MLYCKFQWYNGKCKRKSIHGLQLLIYSISIMKSPVFLTQRLNSAVRLLVLWLMMPPDHSSTLGPEGVREQYRLMRSHSNSKRLACCASHLPRHVPRLAVDPIVGKAAIHRIGIWGLRASDPAITREASSMFDLLLVWLVTPQEYEHIRRAHPYRLLASSRSWCSLASRCLPFSVCNKK